jgi:RNA polymerase sigma-70 factor (ECF subfamily)
MYSFEVKMNKELLIKEENKLVELAKIDPQFFKPIYQKYYRKVYSYIHKYFKEENISKDLTQQVFLKVMQKIDLYEDRGFSFSSWLYQIAYNEIHSVFRKSSNNEELLLSSIEHLSFENDTSEEDNADRFKKLKNALSRIKPKDLMIIEMRYFDELSFNEIGKYLGVSEGTAKVRCFRAVEKLREVYFMTR